MHRNPICSLPHAADVEHVANDDIRSLISEGSRPFVILPNKSLHFVSAFQQQLNGRATCVSCGSGNQNRLRAAVGFDLISGCCINILSWIEEYAAAIGASETLFGMYDAEEEHSGAESQAR